MVLIAWPKNMVSNEFNVKQKMKENSCMLVRLSLFFSLEKFCELIYDFICLW
jgi:hypothetical protein